VLLLVRQQFKSAKSHQRERLERAVAAVYNKQETPIYWMECAAFTGPAEALFLGPYDSFEALEKAAGVLGALNEAHPELGRMQAGIDDALSSQRTILAVRRDSAGVNDINLARARFLRMLVVQGEEFPSAGVPMPAVVYEVKSGMPGPAYLILQALTEFTDLPVAQVAHGTVVEDVVYAVEPDLSHVSHAFAEQGPELWMRKAETPKQ
jgi:hypothetical protein